MQKVRKNPFQPTGIREQTPRKYKGRQPAAPSGGKKDLETDSLHLWREDMNQMEEGFGPEYYMENQEELERYRFNVDFEDILLSKNLHASRINEIVRTNDYGEARIIRYLAEVGLSLFDADRKVKNYSGGMKRKLSIAMTMITAPQVAIFDQLSAGVDARSQRLLWKKIARRAPGQMCCYRISLFSSVVVP